MPLHASLCLTALCFPRPTPRQYFRPIFAPASCAGAPRSDRDDGYRRDSDRDRSRDRSRDRDRRRSRSRSRSRERDGGRRSRFDTGGYGGGGGGSYGSYGGDHHIGGTGLSSNNFGEQVKNLSFGDPARLAHRDKLGMKVVGENPPDPFMSFEDVGFPPDIMGEIAAAGFKEPTAIQCQAWCVARIDLPAHLGVRQGRPAPMRPWLVSVPITSVQCSNDVSAIIAPPWSRRPIAMQGRDVVAIAKTGSGKTCAFLLPGLLHIRATRKDPRMGPTILVLAPTRELAVQIKGEADKFGVRSGVYNTCTYGGAPKGPQLSDIRRGVHIIIATPGRLNDFLEAGHVNLSQVSYLVLDEADRMLDMGFEPQIQSIVARVPRQRQTLFFSATWPREVKSIAAQFVVNQTVHVFLGDVEEKLVANKDITQRLIFCAQFDKMRQCMDVLRSFPRDYRIIVFCGTKRGCDDLEMMLRRDGFQCAAIHGDKGQRDRDWVLQSFKSGRISIMIATDVAARGLDIKGVNAVINFDFPSVSSPLCDRPAAPIGCPAVRC